MVAVDRTDFYPGLCSPEAVLAAPSTWTADIVVRSLRRRLWKAFVDEDHETALRAYQATFQDFLQWIQEEDNLRHEEAERRLEHGKRDKRGFMVRRPRSSKLQNVSVENELEESQKKEDDLRQLFGNDSILETRMNPSERFRADDMLSPYDVYNHPPREDLPNLGQYEAEQQAIQLAIERGRQRRRGGARQAFRMVLRRGSTDDESPRSLESTPAASSDENIKHDDIYMTTPLHEASRLGAADFVRFLLARGGDPSVKNGKGRTALHMAAGGLTKQEEELRTTQKVSSIHVDSLVDESLPNGIRSIDIPAKMLELMHKDLSTTSHTQSIKKDKKQNGQGLIRRLFGNSNGVSGNVTKIHSNICRGGSRNGDSSISRLESIVSDRMDAFLAVMSWVDHNTGNGPSINSIDDVGRTALHWAAQLGRDDICMVILGNFEAMLTVVDDLGARTPCELAAAQGYPELAGLLEARALLYIDPYGFDDDMMEEMLRSRSGQDSDEQLTVPFAWFKTNSFLKTSDERYRRLSDAKSKIVSALANYEGSEAGDTNNPKNDGKVELPNPYSLPDIDDDCTSLHDLFSRMMEERSKLTDTNNSSESDGAATIPPGDKVRIKFYNLRDEHVEKFLTFHKWNVSDALAAFMKDPIKAFDDASISLPQYQPLKSDSGDRTCPICYDADVEDDKWINLSGCSHGFCTECLHDYLGDLALAKTPAFNILCPQYPNCQVAFLKCDIERVLKESPSVLSRLDTAITEHFISTSSDVKFCPHPGCDGIVHRLSQQYFERKCIDMSLMDYTGATCVAVGGPLSSNEPTTLTYEGVKDDKYTSLSAQPRRAHRFCFACSEPMHWPVTCQQLSEWKEKVKQEVGDDNESGEATDYNELAQKLWIKTNTRPCPLCNVRIEKQDGCNHMTCSNPSCLHEFCWICRKDWKLHGSATGGFYRCNIWQEDESQPVTARESLSSTNIATDDASNDEGYGTAIHSAREAWKRKQEMDRFLHHFSRFEAHDASAALERQMADSACERLAPVVKAAIDFSGLPSFDFNGQGLSFIHAAFMELQECRSILKHSYAFAYCRYPSSSARRSGSSYLDNFHKERKIFQRLQYELETMTEQLSDIVARSHLRATQVQIQHLTVRTADTRKGFTFLVLNILNEEKMKEKRDEKSKGFTSSNGTFRPPPSALSEYLAQRSAMRRNTTNNDELAGRANNDLDLAMNALRMNLDLRRRTDMNDEGSDDDVDEAPTQMWHCPACTFMNSSAGHRCEMCGTRRVQ